MADVTKDDMLRIEDFIALANEGKEVKLEVSLRKQAITQKVHPGETDEMKGELNMYLFIGDYLFSVGNWKKTVSKIYVYGSGEESLNNAKINISIANERLKMDYLEQGDVAADSYADEALGQPRPRAEQTRELLRMPEAQPALPQRVHAHDPAAAARRGLERSEHARVVAARVLAHDEDEVGQLEVSE